MYSTEFPLIVEIPNSPQVKLKRDAKDSTPTLIRWRCQEVTANHDVLNVAENCSEFVDES